MNTFIRLLGLGAVLFGLYWALDLTNPVLDQPERARLQAAGLAKSFYDSPSGTIHYRLAGPADGTPVLLVHGFSTPMFVFDSLVEELTQAGYRTLTFDLYGRGLSDRPKGDFDANLVDRQILDLLDGLSIKQPVHLVGYSMGGAAATIFAARHRDRLLSASLIAPAGLELPGLPVWMTWPIIGDLYARLGGHLKAGRDGLESAREAVTPANFATAYVLQSRYRGYPEALMSTLRHYPLGSAQGDYDAVGVQGLPVLAIWGANDVIVKPDNWQELNRRIPQARLVKVEGVGHEITYARPKVVGDALIDFWSGLNLNR